MYRNPFDVTFVLYCFTVYRIIRGIEIYYGNMLLTGVSGTGRHALSRLAAFILNYDVFEIELKKNYGICEFRQGRLVF